MNPWTMSAEPFLKVLPRYGRRTEKEVVTFDKAHGVVHPLESRCLLRSAVEGCGGHVVVLGVVVECRSRFSSRPRSSYFECRVLTECEQSKEGSVTRLWLKPPFPGGCCGYLSPSLSSDHKHFHYYCWYMLAKYRRSSCKECRFTRAKLIVAHTADVSRSTSQTNLLRARLVPIFKGSEHTIS